MCSDIFIFIYAITDKRKPAHGELIRMLQAKENPAWTGLGGADFDHLSDLG